MTSIRFIQPPMFELSGMSVYSFIFAPYHW